MSNLSIKIHNLTTSKEIQREMNAEELSQLEKDKASRGAERSAESEQKALKDLANAKLAALGLTPEEIAALTGA
jgi:hypothetical protein